MQDSNLPLSATLEDYIEAIARLVSRDGAARAGDIAEALSVHKSTVTSALKGLSEKGLVNYHPYAAITLTPEGREVAQDVRARHEVVRRFLREVLRVDDRTAEANACRMEHVMDPEVLRRLASFAEFARNHPKAREEWLSRLEESGPAGRHGHAHRHGQETRRGLTTLDAMEPGQRGKVVRISHSGPIRRRMVDMGLARGTEVEVLGVAPLGDPIEVKLKGYNLSLRKLEARAIEVELDGSGEGEQ